MRSRAALATLLMTALAASSAQAADVYRCVAGGGIEYTDRPCAGGERVTIDAARAGIVLVGAPVEPAGAATPVVPGMQPKHVYALLGRPRDMNVRIEGIAPLERWWYRTPEGALTVTFRYGRVASVATH
jgi:hypothetical protein